MKAFLQRFGSLVSGVLQGFDRLVFKGRLRQLYSPEGMHTLLALNHVLRSDFQTYAAGVTSRLLASSLVSRAKEWQCFRYLSSSKVCKEKTARELAARASSERRTCLRAAVYRTLLDIREKEERGGSLGSTVRKR